MSDGRNITVGSASPGTWDTNSIVTPPRSVIIHFHNDDGKAVVSINPGKGTVWIDASMTVDDAAREFWAAVKKLAPG